MPNQKVIFFEDLKVCHYPLLIICFLLKYKVFVFEYESNLKNSWLKGFINSGKIKRIYFKPSTPEHGLGIDLAEKIYPFFNDSSIVASIRALYNNPYVELIFKKNFVYPIYRCVYINKYLRDWVQKNSSSVPSFVPIDYFNVIGLLRRSDFHLHELKHLSVWSFARPLGVLHRFMQKCKYISALYAYIAGFGFSLLIGKAGGRKIPPPIKYKYAVPISTRVQIENSGGRGIELLVDGETVKKENTVFITCVNLSESDLKKIRSDGYQILDLAKLSHLKEIAKYKYCARDFFLVVRNFPFLLLSLFSPLPLLKSLYMAVRVFLKWSLAYQYFSFDHFIYTNLEGAEQTAVNLFIKKNKGKTWNYSSFLGGGYINSSRGRGFRDVRHVLWSFQIFDHWLGFNQDVIEYNKLHHQVVGQYHSIGSLYSDLILNQMTKDDKKKFLEKIFHLEGDPNEVKLISFFDTSFVDNEEAPTDYHDAINFYTDILRYIKEHKNVFVIIKPSKHSSYFVNPDSRWSSPLLGQKIVSLWNRLKEQERVFWAFNEMNQGGLDFSYNNEIISASDVVITHCLSSPTAEALGAGKPAFWYESGNKHREVMYEAIPGLVVHGYEALEARLHELFYEKDPDSHKAYSKNYIYGKIISHSQHGARKEFRRLLTEATG